MVEIGEMGVSRMVAIVQGVQLLGEEAGREART